jgi:predicted nucleic acid-binding protein
MNRIIFDTSVWIEYFKVNPEFFTTCQTLLEERSVYTLEIIFAELLQGAKGKRELGMISGYYENLPKLDHEGLIFEAGLYFQKENLISKGVGLIDSIIISAALKNKLRIWTLDKRIIGHLDAENLFAVEQQ